MIPFSYIIEYLHSNDILDTVEQLWVMILFRSINDCSILSEINLPIPNAKQDSTLFIGKITILLFSLIVLLLIFFYFI